MKDSELRGVILKKLYEVRHQHDFLRIPEGLELPNIDPHVVGNVSHQLDEQGLIKFSQVMGNNYRSGHARILSYGVDVVEETTTASIAISFDQSVNVHSSNYVQIGTGNIQNAKKIEKLYSAIDNESASQGEREAAKSLLGKLTENKLLITIFKKLGLDLS